MSFNMVNRDFEEVFGEGIKTDKKTCRDFMKTLRGYLAKEDSISAKKILRWIEEGNQLDTFTCRQDVVEAMSGNLSREGIPYVLVNETTGRVGFLIRASDGQAIKRIRSRTLTERSNTCRISNNYDTGMIYLRGREEDKTMLLIGGLKKEEAFYFVSQCGGILPGETIGVDRMPDGTYLLTVHAKTAMRIGRKASFPGAVAEALVAVNGETKEEVKEDIARRFEYLGEKNSGFPDQTGGVQNPVWIVGTGYCFVKRTSEGFDAGHALDIDGNILLESDYRVDKKDKRYRQRLNSALARTTKHRCLYTVQDVIEYYRTPRRMLPDEKEIAQQMLVRHMASLVTKKTNAEKIMRMDAKWEHKFRHFQKEMRRVAEGAAMGKVPKGYSKADIVMIRKEAKEVGVSLKAIAPCVKRYAELDTYAREAGMPRVTDLEVLIGRLSGVPQKEREEVPAKETHDKEMQGR